MPLPSDLEDMLPEKPEPCVGCGKDSECAVWGHRVCYPCASDWRDRAPTYGDLEAKYGQEFNAPEIYRAFTARWLAARNARAA